jgi:hypothetical protein
LTARPRRLTAVCWICAVAVVALFSGSSVVLHGRSGSGGHFERGDQVSFILLGLVVAAGVLAFTRPRVVADESGVRVRNIIGHYDLPWDVVTRVRFDNNSPWVTLDLVYDEQVAVMAVQAADKEYAVHAVTELRRLLAAHQHAGNEDRL